jgi:apolipoprotein N-acyltransferase
MNQLDAPNPEQRSNNAMLCFGIGLGLLGLSWLLGVGAVFTAALSGGLAGVAMGFVGALVLMLAACSGVTLMLIGVIWIVIRVVSDQTGDESRQRYKDVQR